jgi:hypothetical protein
LRKPVKTKSGEVLVMNGHFDIVAAGLRLIFYIFSTWFPGCEHITL